MGKVKEAFLHSNGRMTKLYIHDIDEEYLNKEVHFKNENKEVADSGKSPVDRIFDEMYGQFNHLILQSMSQLAHRIGCTEGQAIKYISPRLLVPVLCEIIGLDELEYGNEVFKSLKWVVEWAEIEDGFAKVYRCKNACKRGCSV